MTRPPLRRLGAAALGGLLALTVLGACSDDDGGEADAPTTTPTEPGATTTEPDFEQAWIPEQRARALELAAALTAATDGECEPNAYIREQYLQSFFVLDWPIPRYAGACAFDGEDLEILVFEDGDAAEEYLEDRVERLCDPDNGLPGYPWARVDDAVFTPDSEQVATTVADALDGDGGWVDCAAEQD